MAGNPGVENSKNHRWSIVLINPYKRTTPCFLVSLTFCETRNTKFEGQLFCREETNG